MNEIANLIKVQRHRRFTDENGNQIGIELREAVTDEAISQFEAENAVSIPSELKKLLEFTNGLVFLGLHVLSIDEIEFFPNTGLLSFHNWGNGDFDCISTGKVYPENSVIFMNHSEDEIAFVSPTLEEWLKRVSNEIGKYGALLHPMDYMERQVEGMYKNIKSV